MAWNKTYNENAHFEEDAAIDMDTGEVIERPKVKTAKYPNAKEVFALFSTNDGSWVMKKPILGAAQRLYDKHGIAVLMRAMAFYKDNIEQRTMPRIYNPLDLENKWLSLKDKKDNGFGKY